MKKFKRLLISFIGIFILMVLMGGCSSQNQDDIPKGVVLILVDDIGYGDVNALYPGDLETPSLDGLYQESVRLTDFHVATTCSPTRASLMTGRNINATGVWHTIAGRSILRAEEQTMAEVFQSNGWTTGIFGKWHLGDGYPYYPRHRGFETEVIHGGGGVGQQPDYYGNNYYASVDHEGNETTADVYFKNGEEVVADEYCTDFWFSEAMSFMEKSLEKNTPFFCYLPLNAAHGPFNAPYGYKEGFDGLVENVDDNMSRLDEFLREQGISEDVLLIFTTDNGTAGNRFGGLRGKKGSHYDGGHHVPCFWRWEEGGIGGSAEKARDVNALTVAADFLPTFMDLFGLEKPEGGKPLDGISLTKMLLDPGYTPSDRIWVIDTQREAELKKWRRAAVLKDEVKNGKIVHKWRLIRDNAVSGFEVYDFLKDREQQDNIEEENQQVVDELKKGYESWWSTISEDQEAYPAYVLGVEPVTLYSHDWIGANTSPWHQIHVRRAAEGTRTSSVQFAENGLYRFELRRWPQEDGSAINTNDANGEGKALQDASRARLSIENIGEWEKDIEPGSAKVVFEAQIQSGEPTKLRSAIMNDDNEILCGAYYIYVRKVED